MIRVCCYDDCKIPNRIFGCTESKGKKLLCDECKNDTPMNYKDCLQRSNPPDPEDSTHGLCQECDKKMHQVLAQKRLNSSLNSGHNIHEPTLEA